MGAAFFIGLAVLAAFVAIAVVRRQPWRRKEP